jgi:predicted 2-oxoglutarate/Fe(II)-dependent dioxygenase YbiX
MARQVDMVENDLNSVIASAVQARIETEVASALSGSELMGQYVAAALTQTIRVEKNYRSRETTYLRETIDAAIQSATKAAVNKVVAESAPEIEKLVATELRKNLKGISAQIVGNLVEKADSPYGISVEVKYPGKDSDF